MTKLHYLVDENGMNLTYALLNTIIKYPVSSMEIREESGDIKEKKMGYIIWRSRRFLKTCTKETGTNGKRHPLTYILEAADDLAYKTADIEDAFVKGYISYPMLESELKKLKKQCPNAAFDGLEKLQNLYTRGKEKGVRNPESYALKNWIVRVQGFLINCATFGFTSNYEAIMSGTYKKDLFYGTFGEQLMDLLGRMAYENVFCSRDIYRMEISESVMLDFLMDQFVGAVLYYDTNHPLGTIDERLVSFISDNYRNAYRLQTEGKNEAEKLYLRLLLVTDFVCGMTDGYAKRLYQEMKAML